MRRALGLIMLVLATAASAQDIRPIARGSAEATISAPQTRPSVRPSGLADAPRFQPSQLAVLQSMRPVLRPATVEAAGIARREALRRGQVCGDPGIQGREVGTVQGRGACGIDQGVLVRSVAGVALRSNATIDCPTARALKTWVERGVLPAVGNEGGGVASLRVVSHYACRTRNNQPGARLSEHSFGRAIDIAGIGLRDGSEMTLLTDWNSAEDGAQLRQMWRAACGPFGTVLGPEANRFHRDHFHFDTARYRSGPFCR